MYGMPYKGSKNRIAEWVIDILPSADVLVDAFGGGGAITHCALLSNKWNKVIYNELEPLIAKGFEMAVNGKFKDEHRWISREEFFRLRETDPYVAMCFSFGNNLVDYCYGKPIEEAKKSLHDLVMSPTESERYAAWRTLYKNINKINSNTFHLQSLEALQRLQSLEALQRSQGLEALNMSYEDIVIPPNSVVYCDIPYKGTKGYKQKFDYDKFYDWALKQDCYVFISEYEMPEQFCLVAEKNKTSSLCVTNRSVKTIERIYCNKPYKATEQTNIFDFIEDEED